MQAQSTFNPLKNHLLGHGSYGAVYKTKCDQLPCAAKIVHSLILDPQDPGATKIMERFKQECTFLKSIQHPNIVQYLGMTEDPESRLPVLLMELLDESLTKMLERSQQSLAYHVQVDICHDIALAVAYLHSNDIIHRDLSSNNVLVIAGRRAKVTDFGMAKLVDRFPTMTPLTKCPGTQVYMPPEALREPPRYTKKLDCFSEGVIMIQVCTRLWPEPGPRTERKFDPSSPTGEVEVPVLEMERRKSHIDIISPDHCLLSIALDCLQYHEDKRPSSDEICQRLWELKESTKHSESTQEEIMLQNEVTRLEKQIEDIHMKEAEYIQEIEMKESELQKKLRQKDRAHSKALRQKDSQLQSKNSELIARAKQIRRLEQQIEDQAQYTAEIQQTNLTLRRQVEQLQKCLDLNTETPHPKVNGNRQNGPVSMHWRNGGRVPVFEMARGDTVVKGNIAYFMSYNGVLCSYDSAKKTWSKQTTLTTYKCSSLVVIRDLLTTVGGFYSYFIATDKLLVLIDRDERWVEEFPPMPTKRYNTTAVTSEQYLIVAGGKSGSSKTSLSTVEVMETSTKTWSTVASLPHPYSGGSGTVCGDQIYMLGGCDDSKEKMTVLACSVTQLLRASPSAWHRVADTTAYCSTCTTINRELVAVGGYNWQGTIVKDVYRYDLTTNSWRTVRSSMPTPRYDCLVAVLPTNEIMVVGGREHLAAGNKVEIATYVS